jgi:hypothetical protein
MPYKSKKQRGWMYVNEPEIAEKWDKKYGGKIEPSKPKKKPKSKKKGK